LIIISNDVHDFRSEPRKKFFTQRGGSRHYRKQKRNTDYRGKQKTARNQETQTKLHSVLVSVACGHQSANKHRSVNWKRTRATEGENTNENGGTERGESGSFVNVFGFLVVAQSELVLVLRALQTLRFHCF
jgi:hypothetical protein